VNDFADTGTARLCVVGRSVGRSLTLIYTSSFAKNRVVVVVVVVGVSVASCSIKRLGDAAAAAAHRRVIAIGD